MSCNKERYSHLLKQSAMWWCMTAHLWPFWVQPRTRQRWCCREGGSVHAIVASQQGPHEWQGHDGCPTPTSRCLCLDLADAVRFVCPKSNETLLTPGDIATSTRISLYKGSYIGSFILTQFIWTSGISLRSRFPRYDQSFCPDQKSVLRTEKIERHEKAQKTVSVRFTCSCWRDCGTQRSFGETGPFWCTFDQVCPAAWVATPQSVWRWEDTWLSRWRIRLGIWCSKCLCHSKIKWCQSFAALKRICIVSWMVSWQPRTHDAIYIYIHAVFGLYIYTWAYVIEFLAFPRAYSWDT